jgi:hypothetical protein
LLHSQFEKSHWRTKTLEKMTVLLKQLNEFVEKCKKFMKIVGVHVIDANFSYTIPLFLTIFMLSSGTLCALHSFYVIITKNDFEKILKNIFVLGVIFQVRERSCNMLSFHRLLVYYCEIRQQFFKTIWYCRFFCY